MHSSLTLPWYAVIVAVPLALAVTLPLLSTVATDVLLLFHLTVLSVALLGVIVADNWVVSFTFKLIALVFNVILVTGTVISFCLTVITHVAFLDPLLAVITTSPAPTAVTLPLLTVAIFVLLDDHVIFLLVALLGFIVADKLIESFTYIIVSVIFIVIVSTSTVVCSTSFTEIVHSSFILPW